MCVALVALVANVAVVAVVANVAIGDKRSYAQISLVLSAPSHHQVSY